MKQAVSFWDTAFFYFHAPIVTPGRLLYNTGRKKKEAFTMNDISEKEYPQASKGGAAQAPGAVEGFDRHGAIHNRPGRIESWERTGEGLLLRTETRA